MQDLITKWYYGAAVRDVIADLSIARQDGHDVDIVSYGVLKFKHNENVVAVVARAVQINHKPATLDDVLRLLG